MLFLVVLALPALLACSVLTISSSALLGTVPPACHTYLKVARTTVSRTGLITVLAFYIHKEICETG